MAGVAVEGFGGAAGIGYVVFDGETPGGASAKGYRRRGRAIAPKKHKNNYLKAAIIIY